MRIVCDHELWPIEKVIPYHNNVKKHPEAQVNKLASMIVAYGWDQPIAVDEHGIVIKGHCRLEAAKKLGMTEVPVIVRTDLTPAECKANRLADNKIAEGGETDRDLLKIELEELESLDFDVDLSGYSLGEFDDPSDVIKKPKDVDGAKELSEDDFQRFEHTCPRCGFEFDK